ncbi:MAG: hypothetical protein M1818_001091 [Claussenomyces sp. TS43310]|nr:MAG: hypothetical protein M1818_001091 [Claussenomyces sp. TS43310]
MSSSKRTSTLPKPPTSFAPSIVVSDTATLVGTHGIVVRDSTIIHPRARILSAHGPVTIGSSCILSERSCTGLQDAAKDQLEGVIIEDGVVLEVGSVVEARRVGKGSLIEINANIGKGAIIGKHCTIGPLCSVGEGEVLPDYTVIYGAGIRRIDKSAVEEMKAKTVSRQAEALKKLVPSNLAKYQA